jgi:hypothetical protein
MNHLHLTAAELRRAYQRAGATPAAGTWYYRSDDGRAYQCPLHVVFGSGSTLSAPADTGSPRECIVGFLRGWDGHQPCPEGCAQCYQLGARLRAKLNPIQLD